MNNIYFDFFNNENSFTLINISNIRYNTNYENFFLINCIFISLNFINSNGGAISVSLSTKSNMLINSCSFFNCNVGNSCLGGAIYFVSSNYGEFYMTLTCGNKCSTGSSSNGQFCFVTVSINKRNYHYMNSINLCANEYGSQRYQSYRVTSGEQNVNSLNSSNNLIVATSGFSTYSPTFLNLKYSNFMNSKTSIFVVLNILEGFNNTINNINLINNSQIDNSYGIIMCGQQTTHICNLTILNSIFLNNNGKLFSCGALSNFFIKDCSIDNINPTVSGGNIILLNNNNLTFTNHIINLKTYLCDSEFTFNKLTLQKKNQNNLKLLFLKIYNFF